MIYEFLELEHQKRSKLIGKLVIKGIAYIEYRTTDTVLVITTPSILQELVVKIFEKLHIYLMFLAMILAVISYNIDLIVTLFLFICLLYKIRDMILIFLLHELDKGGKNDIFK